MKHKIRVAAVGCGAISGIYFHNITTKFNNLELVACCANHLESALKKAEEFGIKGCTYEEILADSSIEMILVLTPAPTHYELILKALMAGKHVYTEKPITIDLEEAKELARAADERNLYLGSAPETFLGSAVQTAKKAVEEGMIGEITSFHLCANRSYDMLTSFCGFLRLPGGGICYDYSVYYLTALINILGAVDSVSAILKNPKPVRTNICPQTPDYGEEYSFPNESLAAAILQMESGVLGTFMMNGESNMKDLADFRIYGTKGVLKLPDPNQFGDDVVFIPNNYDPREEVQETVLENQFLFSDNMRGIGAAEMALAIEDGRKCRTDKETGIHVLDVVEKMVKSSESGRLEKTETTCSVTELFLDGEKLL